MAGGYAYRYAYEAPNAIVYGAGPGTQISLRDGPSTGNAVIAWVNDGENLQVFGCDVAGNIRWCEVQTLHGSARGVVGWMSDRHLAPAGYAPAYRGAYVETYVAPVYVAPPPPVIYRRGHAGVTYNTTCSDTRDCLAYAQRYCDGDYYVVDSAVSPADHGWAGLAYTLDYRCGAGPGVYPTFGYER
jgi:hypothetical protein